MGYTQENDLSGLGGPHASRTHPEPGLLVLQSSKAPILGHFQRLMYFAALVLPGGRF